MRRSSAVLCALVLVIAPTEIVAEPLRISIEDAMRIGLHTSRPLAAARAGVERARADIQAARSGYFPQVDVSGSYVRTIDSEFDALFAQPGATAPGAVGAVEDPGLFSALPFGRRHAWRAGIDATQMLWDGGRTRAGVRIADGARASAELDERTRRAQIVVEVVEAYYDALLADQLVRIGEASLELATRTFAEARLGFEQGSKSEFDMVRAEVTRDNQRAALVRARGDRDFAQIRLRHALRVPLDAELVLTSELAGASDDLVTVADRYSGGPPREAVGVAGVRAVVETRAGEVALARAARWPQVTAFTSLGVVNYPDGFLVDGDWRRNWTVGVNVAWPLFTGYRTTARIRGVRADQRAAEELLAEARAQTAAAERRAAITVDVARASLEASTRSAELARRAQVIADERYRQGVSTLLELSDTRLAHDQAQVNAASAARDLQVARVRQSLLPLLPLPAPTAAAPAQTTPLRAAPLLVPAPIAPPPTRSPFTTTSPTPTTQSPAATPTTR